MSSNNNNRKHRKQKAKEKILSKMKLKTSRFLLNANENEMTVSECFDLIELENLKKKKSFIISLIYIRYIDTHFKVFCFASLTRNIT